MSLHTMQYNDYLVQMESRYLDHKQSIGDLQLLLKLGSI
jgi:hypothetical protein